jgi:hypothetical protein
MHNVVMGKAVFYGWVKLNSCIYTGTSRRLRDIHEWNVFGMY